MHLSKQTTNIVSFSKEYTDLFPEGSKNSIFPEGQSPEGNMMFSDPEGNKICIFLKETHNIQFIIRVRL